MKIIIHLASVLWLASLTATAEFRTLVSNDGKAIKAELVTHSKGMVTIRREDGQEFEVDPAIFCKQDQDAIAAWMKEHKPKIDYRLRVDSTKKTESTSDYSASWHYEIEVRNDGQDPVTGIKIQYRVLYETYGSEKVQEDEHLLEQKLEFNRTLVLKTDTIRLSRSKSNRNSGVRGCLVRILDPEGNVIQDWGSNEVGMKGVTWESSTPREPGAPDEKKVEIR